MMEDLNPVIEHLRRQRETWTEVVAATTGMKIFRISEDGLTAGYCVYDPEDWESEDHKYYTTLLWTFETVLMNYPLLIVNASAGPLWEKLASLNVKRYSPREATNTTCDVIDSMPRGTFRHGREVVST